MGKNIDLNFLNETADGDSEFITDLLKNFKDDILLFLKELENEIKAGEKAKAKRTAHKIKPMFLYVGNDECSEKAGYIEKNIENCNLPDKMLAEVHFLIQKSVQMIAEIDEYLSYK
ncbi:MAG: Hpt domain-containing protein [Ignavibacteriales bacterium]|nr:Hpt domain-containing protein [Ignavibacteriales bacterium]MCF8306264.1 Hpt domain-containing protein [Ignavibacteriales bacterium]MCF8315985.1 Hpt domain-containing protein [Ignavibacteriales bacterium]MCF8437579.1 Hpt domain-containing protein [Ignavibacteriales bacterium]